MCLRSLFRPPSELTDGRIGHTVYTVPLRRFADDDVRVSLSSTDHEAHPLHRPRQPEGGRSTGVNECPPSGLVARLEPTRLKREEQVQLTECLTDRGGKRQVLRSTVHEPAVAGQQPDPVRRIRSPPLTGDLKSGQRRRSVGPKALGPRRRPPSPGSVAPQPDRRR